MPTPTSQGSTVSWGASPIGLVTSIRANPATAVFEDATNVTSTVWGEGVEARIVRQSHCVAVDPGTVEVGLFGVPPFALADIGGKAVLSISLDGDGLSEYAFLESFDVSATVGEFLVGTARFRFSGDPSPPGGS